MSPAEFVDTGRGETCDARQVVVDEEAHRQGDSVPSARDQATKWAAGRGHRIHVKVLRVELAREFDDFALFDWDRSVFVYRTRNVVFEIPVADGRRESSHVKRSADACTEVAVVRVLFDLAYPSHRRAELLRIG